MKSIITTLNVGNHTFVITDNTLSHNGDVYARNIKIEGDCAIYVIATISIHKSSFTIHETDYVAESFIIVLLRTLFEYIHKQIPTVTQITFDDNTTIESVNGLPIPLCHFYMAFYGKTWYEKHFNARQSDPIKHAAYKTKLYNVLHSKVLKTDTKYIDFLQISRPSIGLIDELEYYYAASSTFSEFFHSISITVEWTTHFMEYYLHDDVFSNTNWIIEFPLENRDEPYISTPNIRYSKIYKDFGVDVYMS